MFIAALFTIARTWKQPKCATTDEWIKKMRYIYTMEYYSAIKRNEIGSFVEMWMDLESVMQSEVSKKEKNKYCILTHICRIQKNGTDEPICRAGREMQTQRMDTWTQQGRGGWDELGDQVSHKYTTMCKIDSQWEPAVQHTELSSVLCDNLHGQDEGSGREVQEGGDIDIHIADSLHCTAETNTTL